MARLRGSLPDHLESTIEWLEYVLKLDDLELIKSGVKAQIRMCKDEYKKSTGREYKRKTN